MNNPVDDNECPNKNKYGNFVSGTIWNASKKEGEDIVLPKDSKYRRVLSTKELHTDTI